MRIAHVLRRSQPAEWGGTDSTLSQVLDGLREHGVDSVMFCPEPEEPNELNGREARSRREPSPHYFHTCLPIWGLPRQQRRGMRAIGSNLMSFDLLRTLRFAPALELIHVYATGLVGALSRRAAKLRRIPCIVTLTDECLDIPETEGPAFVRRPFWSCDWGKLPGFFLRSSRLLDDADAVVTSSQAEAGLLAEKFPEQRICFLPHGVAIRRYETDCREQAMNAFPGIAGRKVILCLARIEPSSNQQWLLYQLSAIRSEYPDALIVFAGPCVDVAYRHKMKQSIDAMDLHGAVLMAGAFPSGDPRLIGLMQHASAMVLPSVVEPSGLAITEAWAAGLPVIANRSAGASAFIHHDYDGWLFDISNPHTFQEGLRHVLTSPHVASRFVTAGCNRVRNEFDHRLVAGRLKALYEELLDERLAARELVKGRGGARRPVKV